VALVHNIINLIWRKTIVGIGVQELMIILFVVVLLFGAKKIPELAAGVGKGIREFKKASKGDYDDEVEDENEKEK
jgi:sec-independent protein translocase protein TatA